MHDGAGDVFGQRGLQLVALLCQQVAAQFKVPGGNQRCAAESDDVRRVLGAGAQSRFVIGAAQHRLQSCSTTDKQGADSFGGIDLMTSDRQQVHIELVRENPNFSERLSRIGVK